MGLHAHPLYPLVVAANRDEFLDRPSEPARFWPEAPGFLAGRDLRAGGTWLGVTRSGRFAALTNIRDPLRHDPGAPSRGDLVVRFLLGRDGPVEHLAGVAAEPVRRNPYNLLAGAGGRLAWHSNAVSRPREVGAGVHAVSNALLDTPWPKTTRSAARLAEIASRKKLSELRKGIPVYPTLRTSVTFRAEDKAKVLKRLKAEMGSMDSEELLTMDGFRHRFEDGWALVRASGTEPKIRLLAEARGAERADEIMRLMSDAVRRCVK